MSIALDMSVVFQLGEVAVYRRARYVQPLGHTGRGGIRLVISGYNTSGVSLKSMMMVTEARGGTGVTQGATPANLMGLYISLS